MARFNRKLSGLQALFLGLGLTVLITSMPSELKAYRHHATNVNYQEYSQSVFDRAETENKPIFMLLSATWCYWCNAYTERTLETPEVTGFLNENFINVFVDLDQRQDLEKLYVSRGIPTSVVFTPQGKEFISFSGLLDSQEFLDGMGKVLSDIRTSSGKPYKKRYASVRNVRLHLEEMGKPEPVKDWADRAEENSTLFRDVTLDAFDMEQGGFGGDKKYPLGVSLQNLLQDPKLAENTELFEAVTATLSRIAKHLYDPVEGGFFRYADSRTWSRIRREKMITTNARLVRVFQLAKIVVPLKHQPAGDLRYERIYARSKGFLLDTFTRPEGGFYSSLDGKWPGYYRKSAQDRRAAKRKPKLDRTVYTAWNAEAVVHLTEVVRTDPDPRLRKALDGALHLLAGRLSSPQTGFRGYFIPGDNKMVGFGQATDNGWGALAMIVGYRLTGNASYLRRFEETIVYSRKHLFIPALGAFRLWNVPAHAGLRDEERVAEEIPLTPNAVLALALIEGHRATGQAKYRTLAEEVLTTLQGLELDPFDENPNDGGNTYLESFAYLIRAQHLLARLGS